MTSIFANDELRPLEDAAYRGDAGLFAPKAERYSATTIKSWKECERKFYWPYVVGIDAPPSGAQQFGTLGHAFVERYLKTGELPGTATHEAAVATAGLRHLPQPQSTRLLVEHQFELPWRVGSETVKVIGTADLVVKPEEVDDDTFGLRDHKFVKQLKWAMSKTQLADDIQSNLYAHVFFGKLHAMGYRALSYVEKQWIYYQKESVGPGKYVAEPTTVTNTREQVERFVRKEIEPALGSMRALVVERPRLWDVGYNEGACGSYGGCPHRQRCFSQKAMESKLGVITQSAAPTQPARPPITKQSIADKARQIRHAATDVNPPPPQGDSPGPIYDAAMKWKAEQAAATKAEEPKQWTEEVKDAAEEVVKRAPKKAKAETPAPAPEQDETPSDDVRKRALGYNPEHAYWLYVGCRPTKGFTGKLISVEELTAQAALDANGVAKESHYRLQFGGHGLLQAAFDRWMAEHPIKGAVVVPEGSLAGSNVLDSLRLHAALVNE